MNENRKQLTPNAPLLLGAIHQRPHTRLDLLPPGPACIAQLTSDGPAILLAPAASWVANSTLNQFLMTSVSGYIDHMRKSTSRAARMPPGLRTASISRRASTGASRCVSIWCVCTMSNAPSPKTLESS